MSSDLEELERLGAHLVLRNEYERGIRVVSLETIMRVLTEGGTTIMVVFVGTTQSNIPDQPIHHRAVLIAISPDRRVTTFHIRMGNIAEVNAGLAKILANHAVAKREKHIARDKLKDSAETAES